MMWSNEIERQVTELFEVAFAAREATTVEACVMGLMKIGLNRHQIENGLAAGAVQMALDLGLPNIVSSVFERMDEQDVQIVVNSLEVL